MNELLSTFSNNKDKRLALKRIQSATDEAAVYSLVKPCDTRWSSSLYAATRMLKLKDYISLVTSIPDASYFWSGLKDLVDCLKPFQEATDILQSDTSTLYDVYSQFKRLLLCIESLQPPHILSPHKLAVKQIITGYWFKHVKVPIVICCAMLSFDTSYEQIFTAAEMIQAKEWLLTFGVSYISYYGLSHEQSQDELKSNLLASVASFMGRSGDFSSMPESIELLRKKAINDNAQRSSSNHLYTYFDPKQVWNLYTDVAPQLSSVARALLSVVASEAAVERSFSMQGMIHSKRKNRMSDQRVEREMFIKFNSLAFDKPFLNQGLYVELTEDYEEKKSDVTSSLFINVLTETVEQKIDDGSVDADLVEMEDDNVDDLQDADPVVITDPVDVFIRQYIRDNHITAGYRWKEWRVNQLESAAATAASRGLLSEPRETVTKYIAMIKALVTTATDENVQSV